MTYRGLLVISAMLAIMGMGCGDDDGGTTPPTPTPDADVMMDAAAGDADPADAMAPANASVRAFHLSPGTPNVDIFVNGGETAAVTDLAFGASTDYLEVPAGTYTFDVAVTGMTVADSALNIPGLELAAGASYTAVAHGALDNTEKPLTGLALADDQTAPMDGNIRVRIVHAAVAANQVDIWNVTDAAAPSAILEDVDYGVASDFLELPAQAYVVGIDTDNDGTPELTFNIPALDAGTIATVFAVSDADGTVSLQAQLGGSTVVAIAANPADAT